MPVTMLLIVTDTLAIDDPRQRGIAWLGSALLCLLAVAGSAWLHRRITPELLTPDNASRGFPGQPGGAPSV